MKLMLGRAATEAEVGSLDQETQEDLLTLNWLQVPARKMTMQFFLFCWRERYSLHEATTTNSFFFFFFFLGGMDIHYTSATIATSRVFEDHHKP